MGISGSDKNTVKGLSSFPVLKELPVWVWVEEQATDVRYRDSRLCDACSMLLLVTWPNGTVLNGLRNAITEGSLRLREHARKNNKDAYQQMKRKVLEHIVEGLRTRQGDQGLQEYIDYRAGVRVPANRLLKLPTQCNEALP